MMVLSSKAIFTLALQVAMHLSSGVPIDRSLIVDGTANDRGRTRRIFTLN